MAAIRTLPNTFKETLVLRLVEGMTGQEIADQTGLSTGFGTRQSASRNENAAAKTRDRGETMNEEYLWNKTGSDAEIEGLENALKAFSYKQTAPPELPAKGFDVG